MNYRITNGAVEFGAETILEELNFEIKDKEKIAIIGRNGAGKSTLLKALVNNDLLTEGIGEDKFNIYKEGNPVIGYLKQMEFEDGNITMIDEILKVYKPITDLESKIANTLEKMQNDKSESLAIQYSNFMDRYELLGGYTYKKELETAINKFGFSKEDKLKKISEFSGGQRAKISFIKLLLSKPDILLLDEPTNHLDMEKLEWLEKFLNEYKGTILMVSHDRYFLDKVATKTILLENGKEKIYFGNYSYFLKEDEKRTLAEFENYKNQQKMIKKMKESIKTLRKFGELAKNEMFFKRAKSIEKKLAKIERLPQVNLEQKTLLNFKLNLNSRSGKDVVIINNLNKNFESKNIFENANLQIHYGEKIALIGKNGTGKSTLLKIIMNEDCEYTGEIKIGQSVNIGYIPQEIKFDDDNQTILNFFEQFDNRNETEIRTSLAKYMFRGNDVFKKVGSLSGGEKVRLILAKLLKQNINFLILDEPTNHIDIETREVLEEAIKEYSGTVLFVSHDRYFINNLAERIVEIKDKGIFSYVGNYDEYLRKIE